MFTSVGLADEKGDFPIKDLIEKSKKLHEVYADQPDKNISEQFLLLSQICPEFATCQNSTIFALKDIILNNENFNFDKCVVDRVYDKSDKKKRPILFVYIDLVELGKRFYFADKELGQFVQLSQDEFTNKFECYETDLKKSNRN